MPSPFPGMNPYLETDDVWSDFHHGYCQKIKATLVPLVQPTFFVKINEHIYVREQQRPRRLAGLADVAITRRTPKRSNGGAVGLLDAPSVVHLPDAPVEERVAFVEIFDKRDRSLVTLIELLSPANKHKGPDREQFLAKRRRVFASGVHYVEIDLLRGGPRLPIEDMPECDYYALVSPAEDRPDVAFWPIGLRDPLPTIPIPLSGSKKRVRVDLQKVLHLTYDEAGYGDYIYDGTPNPRLSKTDAAWATSLAVRH